MHVKKWDPRIIFGVLLASMGLVLTAVTIVHVATFKPEKTVVLTAQPHSGSTFVYTAPGVLNIVGNRPHVTLTASQPNATIEWGYGSSKAVAGYVGSSAALEVQGFTAASRGRLTALATEHHASPKVSEADKKTLSAGGFHLAASDQWSQAGTGKGSVTFDVEVEPGVDRSLIATSSQGGAPTLTLSWVRTERMASPAPFIAMGVLLALIGAVLLLTAWRNNVQRTNAAQQQALTRARKEESAAALTAVLPVFKGDLANPETDRAVQRTHTDGAFGAGVLPGTSRTESLRARELKAADRIVISEAAAHTAAQTAPVASATARAEEVETAAADANEAAAAGGQHSVPGADHAEHEAENITLWAYTEPFENDGDDELTEDSAA
ncbi:MAG: hypothetical protein SPF30_02970 [Arcanobacterium sp.]|nr:hypothetical protein [Arcanobacterium sp.]